jgi:hypothetical protein
MGSPEINFSGLLTNRASYERRKPIDGLELAHPCRDKKAKTSDLNDGSALLMGPFRPM